MREREEEDSWPITTMEHLSRVSLHPTFTGTMSLRSFLALFPPPFLVHVEVVALQNRRNGASFKRCSNIVCISCYLSSSLVLPWMGGPLLGPFVIIDPRWCYRGSKWSLTVVYALNEKNGYHVEYIIFVNVFTSSSFSSIKISYNRIFDQSIDNWIFLCTLLT